MPFVPVLVTSGGSKFLLNILWYTLQEHQKFWTEMETSLISDLLKSMGVILLGFFPCKICKYLRDLTMKIKNEYIV